MSKREVLVDGTHRSRPFTDGCRHALDRTRPDIADSKQPWTAGLKGQRSPAERCPSLVEEGFAKGSVGQHETALIEGHAPRQPIRSGIGTDEGEEGDARQRSNQALGGNTDRCEGPIAV